MGLATGSSCFMHSPFRESFFPTSASQCPFQPPFSFCSFISVPVRRKNATITACLPQESRKNINSCSRRVVLVMGFAVIRLLKMRAEAIDVLASENTELKAPNQKQNAKLSVQGSSSQNPIISFLNALGILGSGVLAALYASTKREMATVDATIESMNMKLKEKEAAITSLEKKIEDELLNEKEIRNKVLAKANNEQQSLVNQLKLANDTITSLSQELQKEKRLAEGLTIQAHALERWAHEADDEKRQVQQQLNEKVDSIAVLQERINLLSSEIKDKEDNIWHLNSKLDDEENEVNQLTFVYQQSQDQIASLNSEIKQLKDVLVKNEEELELKNEMVHKLDEGLTLSVAEKDEFSKKFVVVLEEYNRFNNSVGMKSASDAKILGEREEEIHLLEEKLKTLLYEAKEDEVLISDLTMEKEKLKEMLNVESKNVKDLENGLIITQDNFEKSREEACDLAKELQQSKHMCSEHEAEIGKIHAEFREAKQGVEVAKQGVQILAEELKSASELLHKSNKELQIMSKELVSAVQKCESLQKELIRAHRKAECADVELKEERKITSSLKQEFKDLETQIFKDKESRKNLEADLDEATKSLNEMNRNAMMLSRELEFAKSRFSGLEHEKDGLHNSLDVQKQASQEAWEKLEDAYNLIMRLRKERESLLGRGKRLEEELAAAKGEILRLRSQISSSKNAVRNVQRKQKVDVEGEGAASTRKGNRRRKVNSQQQDS